jgi:hypothetical protein
MKIFLIALFFLFTGTFTNAQVLISLLFGDKLNSGNIEFGLDGGLNWTNINGIDNTDYLMGWNLGFYFDIKLTDPWMLNTGVVVKGNMGAEGLPVYLLNIPNLDDEFSDGGSVTRKLNYFSVPVMIKYTFENHIYVKAGIQLGLMYNGYDTFIKSVKGDDDLKYEVKIKDQYHPLDAGLAFGLGYRLMGGDGMNLGVNYYYGLIDVRIDDSTPSELNQAIYLNVGIPIGK